MPTTITSAGITFNDATSLTSANIGTAQLVNGAVTAEKLGTNEQKQIAKAWVNFNGTTSPGTIRSSYNVSSITKNGTGDYTVNFATAFDNTNYTIVASAGADNINNLAAPSFNQGTTTRLTGSCRFQVVLANANTIDCQYVGVVVFAN